MKRRWKERKKWKEGRSHRCRLLCSCSLPQSASKRSWPFLITGKRLLVSTQLGKRKHQLYSGQFDTVCITKGETVKVSFSSARTVWKRGKKNAFSNSCESAILHCPILKIPKVLLSLGPANNNVISVSPVKMGHGWDFREHSSGSIMKMLAYWAGSHCFAIIALLLKSLWVRTNKNSV